MGPAVLVTLGILFLLANRAEYPFSRTWPILLIVIGAVKVARYVMPDHAAMNPGQYPPPYAGQVPPSGQYPPPFAGTGVDASGPMITPPPPPIAGALAEGKSDREVDNG
jgi:hypothetical protein